MLISLNSSSPGQNGRYFTDDIFKRIFLNENIRIYKKKFVLEGPINNKFSIGSGYGLTSNRRKSITWTNADPVHWRIYNGTRVDEFKFREKTPNMSLSWAISGVSNFSILVENSNSNSTIRKLYTKQFSVSLLSLFLLIIIGDPIIAADNGLQDDIMHQVRHWLINRWK